MGLGLNIVKRLSFEQLGAKEEGYITFLTFEDKKKINRFPKDNTIVICSQKEAMKKEQELENEMHKGQKVVTLKVLFEVIKLIERECDEDFSPPKNITRKQREFLDEFLEEAQQVIRERKRMREIKPYAATSSLQEKYRRAIKDHSLGGYDVIEKLERIFAL